MKIPKAPKPQQPKLVKMLLGKIPKWYWFIFGIMVFLALQGVEF